MLREGSFFDKFEVAQWNVLNCSETDVEAGFLKHLSSEVGVSRNATCGTFRLSDHPRALNATTSKLANVGECVAEENPDRDRPEGNSGK